MTSPPTIGNAVEILPGILWFRLPLPFRLNHVNVYAFEDDDGWTILDTGVADAECRAAWETILAGPLSGRPITRLIASHFHIDHTGLVGWLCERFSPVFFMTQTEYLVDRVFQSEGWREGIDRQASFLQQHGLDAATAEKVSRNRLEVRNLQVPLPGHFERLRSGDTIRLGRRDWRVMTGAGHAVEQIMLHSEAARVFISADQVLPEISPNISVASMLPHADPLGDFLHSLGQIKAEIPDDHLVLPGHRLPFLGLHARIDELDKHHAGRCAAVMQACQNSALTAVDLLPVIFGRNFEFDIIGSAIGEAVAHANYLQHRGILISDPADDGVISFRAA